jgi:type IV pilus assembly protein PilA
MLKIRRHHRRGGFTLIELMIVVALVGLLAAMAIPNFIRYQARTRRSEAFANLSALARAQKAYQAERDQFIDSGNSYPDPTLYNGGVLSPQKMPWDADSELAYSELGWEPEGQVFYSYGSWTATSGLGCGTCESCFTGAAYGDVDGNNSVQTVLFVHPSEVAGVLVECGEPLNGDGTPVDSGGNKIYDSVAARSNSDF